MGVCVVVGTGRCHEVAAIMSGEGIDKTAPWFTQSPLLNP